MLHVSNFILGVGALKTANLAHIGWYSPYPGHPPASAVKLAAQSLEENNLEVGVVRGHSLCVRVCVKFGLFDRNLNDFDRPPRIPVNHT